MYKVAFSNRRNTKMRFSQQPRKIWTYGFVLLKSIVSKYFQPQGEWFLRRSSPLIFDFSKNNFAQFFCLDFAKFRILHLSSITHKNQHKWGCMCDDDMKIIFSKNIDSQLSNALSLTFFGQMLAERGQFEVITKSCIFLKKCEKPWKTAIFDEIWLFFMFFHIFWEKCNFLW